MKFNPKLLECLFGHHQYSKEPIIDNQGWSVHMCEVCGRKGRMKFVGVNKLEVQKDYDEEGNCIGIKWNDGYEWKLGDDGESLL